MLFIGAGTVGSSACVSSSFGAGPSTESGRATERLDDLAGTGGEIAIIADGIDVDDPPSPHPSPPGSSAPPPSTV